MAVLAATVPVTASLRPHPAPPSTAPAVIRGPVGTARQPAPPAAVLEAVPELTGGLSPRPTGLVEWVRTTLSRYSRLTGTGDRGDELVYVVQVRGRFVCPLCPRPAGAEAPHGTAATTVVGVRPGHSSGFILGETPVDLARLGTVHTFPVP